MRHANLRPSDRDKFAAHSGGTDSEQRGVCLQDAAVLAACKAAIGVQNPAATAWQSFARFYEATDQPRPAREMALRWMRQSQARGWHEDAAAAADVAACGETLTRRASSML